MDFFAHLLTTFIIFYQPDWTLLLLFEFFGVFPDLIPFFPVMIYDISKNKTRQPIDLSDPSRVPGFFYVLYDISHSFVTFGICFLIMYLFLNNLAFILMSWGMHILFDMFSHSKPKDIVQTKFLYPITQFSFKGYSWQHRNALIINYSLIAIGVILRIFFITT
ncbi:MAG: hypothetical protein ACFFDN_48835, partial [Candidatus Hodarchaeota archaeon]